MNPGRLLGGSDVEAETCRTSRSLTGKGRAGVAARQEEGHNQVKRREGQSVGVLVRLHTVRCGHSVHSEEGGESTEDH